MKEQGVVEEPREAEGRRSGPKRGVKRGVAGYVKGYNAYLKDTGVDNLPDERCRGADWVRPIKKIDVYRRFYQLGILASSGAAIDGIATAAPVGAAAAAEQQAQQDEMLEDGCSALEAPAADRLERLRASARRRPRTGAASSTATRTSPGTAPSASTRPT